MQRERCRPLHLPAEGREMMLDACTPIPVLGAKDNSPSLSCRLRGTATRYRYPLVRFPYLMLSEDAALAILHQMTVT